MQAKHGTPGVTTEPLSTKVPESLEEAAQNVREGLGPGAVAWERTFKPITSHAGTPIYVDENTGELFDQIPSNLDTDDGKTT